MLNLFPRRSCRAFLEAGTQQTLFGAGLKDLFLINEALRWTPYVRRLSGSTVYVDGGVNIMA
jgi:hypothetical protein